MTSNWDVINQDKEINENQKANTPKLELETFATECNSINWMDMTFVVFNNLLTFVQFSLYLENWVQFQYH